MPGGADTIRGISFQTAVALAEAISMVTDPALALLRVEGSEDVVDYEVIGTAGKRLRVRQAKVKAEPYTWSAGMLLPILRSWAALPDAAETDFEFITDGQLGTTGVQLRGVIEAAKANADEAELSALASRMGDAGNELPSSQLLRRVTLTTRAGSLQQILDSLEHRVLWLMQRARPAALEDAKAVVDGLWRLLFLIGGMPHPSNREVTRDELLARLGLSEADLAGGEAWGDATVRRYRDSILAEPLRDDVVALDVLPAASLPHVLRLVSQDGTERAQLQEPVTVLLDSAPSLLIGATGEGKTTSLRALERHAVGRGDVPVLMLASGHQPGMLPHRIQARVEAVLSVPLATGAAEALLADTRLVVLIDGVSETDRRTREALRNDLAWLTVRQPVRFILAGRDLGAVRAVLPDQADGEAFRLMSLDHAARRAIAGARLPALTGSSTISVIERQLGHAVDNPLLFAMALAVAADARALDDRPHVYEQFLHGLAARARAEDPEFDLLVLGGAYASLMKSGERTANAYTFRDLLESSRQRAEQLPAWRGTTTSAAEILSRVTGIGLLHRSGPDSGLTPLHDSFADYLAATAVTRGIADLPLQLTPAHDEQVLFLAEIAGLDAALSQQVAAQDPLLACRVTALAAGDGDAEPDEVAALLRLLHGDTDLPLLGEGGLQLVRHPAATMVILGGNTTTAVTLGQFRQLARQYPSITLPPRSGSLRVAVHAWASAVRHALRPREPLFSPPAASDPDAVVHQLTAHVDKTNHTLETLLRDTLPAHVARRVKQTLGLGVFTAVVGDPEPGPYGRPVIPVRYRHGNGSALVVRNGDPRVNLSSLATRGKADQLLRRHPSQEAADLVTETLVALTAQTWPVP